MAMSVGNSNLSKSAVMSSVASVLSKTSLKALAQTGSSLSLSEGAVSSQPATSRPLDPLQATAQNTLLSAPLSSLSQPGGSLSSQSATSRPLDLLQVTAQNTLLSASLNSLLQAGGSLSSQRATSRPLDPLQATAQNTLLSAPFSSLSQPGGSLSSQSATSRPLDLLQATAQNTLLSAPRNTGSLPQPGGSFSSQLGMSRPLDLLQASSQNTLLSAPLSSLSQPGGLLSSQPATSCSLDLLQASAQNSLLSAPLSSLSGQSGNTPLSVPLSSLSQLSSEQGSSLDGLSNATSESPPLSVPLCNLPQSGKSPQAPSTHVSTPLSTLSQTPPAALCGSKQANYQHPLLLRSGDFLPSLSLTRSQYSAGSLAELHVDDTADVKSLTEKLENVQILGRSHKHMPSSTPAIPSMADVSMEQQEIKSEHVSVKKQVSTVASIRNNTCPLIAKPTLFGLTLCYSSSVKASSNRTVLQRTMNKRNSGDYLHIAGFDFSTPSPDDIVKERQKGAFLRKK